MRARAAFSLLSLCLAASAGGVLAQAGTGRHPEDKFGADAEGPTLATPYWQSEGGTPDIDFESQGVELGSWLPIADLDPAASSANDCWGYTSPSGREYALIGISTGTAIVEVTDPTHAQLVTTATGPTNGWRDIKTHSHYAYAVSEGGGGIQVIDLDDIDNGTATLLSPVNTGGSNKSHNIAVNEQSGRLYTLGGNSFGLQGFDLSSPSLPVSEGVWNTRYCHDAQVVTWADAPYAGVEIAFCFADDTSSGGTPGLEILNVTDMTNVSVIGSIDLTAPPIFSHAARYSHQGWLSPDRQHVYVNDEVDEGSLGTPTLTRVVDISDLTNPTQVATFSNGGTARDHNLFTLGNLIFEANYRSGLRIFDATNPVAPTEIGFFDTYPPNDQARYNGLWSVYPYFPSGTIIGSDVEKGLFVWRLADDCSVPTITGASVTGCIEGGTTASGTHCIWAAQTGYVCSNTGTQTCLDGNFTATPTCELSSTPLPGLPPGGLGLAALAILGLAAHARPRMPGRRPEPANSPG